jgi:hypothetical protein
MPEYRRIMNVFMQQEYTYDTIVTAAGIHYAPDCCDGNGLNVIGRARWYYRRPLSSRIPEEGKASVRP